MNKYLYIGVSESGYDTSTTPIIVEAEDWMEALNNIYTYVGGKVSQNLFWQATYKMDVKIAIELFNEVSFENIKYFGTVGDAYCDKLSRINEI